MKDSFLDEPLKSADPEIDGLLQAELSRQRQTLDLIASENFAPESVLSCQGSVLTNKYAEGYPGRRYYGGCSVVDEVESLAIARALDLFGAEHANVQPHSGASANAAAFQALLNPGDKVLGLSLAHGGHLTHGVKINFSGRFYQSSSYEVEPDSFLINMDKVAEIASKERPRMIIAGWSAYSRSLDFARFRQIADDIGAYLLVDMSHFSGLVAAGLYPDPVPYADVVTSTVHKTLDGPRAGIILTKEEHAAAIDKAVFPGQQGGPLMHIIAAKAVAFHLAKRPEFVERQRRTIEGARIMAERLGESDGIEVLSGATETHLALLDLRDHRLNGQEAEAALEEINIISNRNAIPFDPLPPQTSSGLRLGTPALVSRGFGDDDFLEVADIIARELAGEQGQRERVEALIERFPLYREK